MKTPLQKWVWERFVFKGFIIRGLSLIYYLYTTHYISSKERLLLSRIESELRAILNYWDESQMETRKMYEPKPKKRR